MEVDELSVGSIDQANRTIINIAWHTKDYVIYRTREGIFVHFGDEKQRKKFSTIGASLSNIYTLAGPKTIEKEGMFQEIARGISTALEDDVETARKILQAVENRLKNILEIKGRMTYQLSGMVVFAIPILLLIANHNFPINWENYDTLLKVSVCGAIGGFLSVTMGLKNVTIDMDASWQVNAIAGASRTLIAISGSILVYLAIKANLLIGIVGEGVDSNLAIYAVSIAAGFSETLVPNLLEKIGSTAGNEE